MSAAVTLPMLMLIVLLGVPSTCRACSVDRGVREIEPKGGVVHIGEHFLVRGDLESGAWLGAEVRRSAYHGDWQSFVLVDAPVDHVVSVGDATIRVRPARLEIPPIASPVALGFSTVEWEHPEPCSDYTRYPAVLVSFDLPDALGDGWFVEFDDAGYPGGASTAVVARGQRVDVPLRYGEGATVCPLVTFRDPSLAVRWQQLYECVTPGPGFDDTLQALVPRVNVGGRARIGAGCGGAGFILLVLVGAWRARL